MTEQKKIEIAVEAVDAGIRLDRFLAGKLPDYSRSLLQKFITSGLVAVDGKSVVQPRFSLREGMVVQMDLPEEKTSDEELVPEDFEFEILFENDDFIIINKPPGVVVHPGAGVKSGTVANALISRYPELGMELEAGDLRPGIVHRLDKDTSGCLVAAKTLAAQRNLAGMFAEHQVKKIYLSLLYGHFDRKKGEIDNFIGRHPVDRQKMAVLPDGRRGKRAVTHYKIVKTGYIGKVPVSLAEIELLTGRTHQIRVHMSNLNHPVLGDLTYGRNRVMLSEAPRQLLHAWRLTIAGVEVKAPVPEDFQAALDAMTPDMADR